VESEPNFNLALESLDRRRDNIELLAVRERGQSTLATVMVPEGKLAAFEKLVESYRTQQTKSGIPKNQRLVANIRDIRRAAVESLWTDSGALPPAQAPLWWEVWLRKADDATANFTRLAAAQEMRVGERHLEFIDRTVLLAFGSVDQLSASVELLDCVAELRKAKDLASFFTEQSPFEQAEWVNDIADAIPSPSEDAPALCLLDTGVNQGHPLLEPLLAPEDLHAIDEDWGVDDHDGHGTEMAGLGAWGDLTDVLGEVAPPTPEHLLESVVLLPPGWAEETPPELYGAYTAAAVALPEIAAPERSRVFSMTITTTDYRDRGKPSSWSAEVDTLCHGGRDELPRLMLISAGNINERSTWRHWMDTNDTEQVHDPGQSWNAITVGAYTEKALFDPSTFPAGVLLPHLGH